MTMTLDPDHRKSDRPLRRLSTGHQPARAVACCLNLRAPSATTLNPFAALRSVTTAPTDRLQLHRPAARSSLHITSAALKSP
jgi:hypothetical protein